MRLIDADKLWKDLDTAHLFDYGNPRHIAQQTVEEQPTINPYEWISVEDRLPDKEGDYIVTEKNGSGKVYVTERGLLYWANGPSWCMSWQERDVYKIKVTHWMPLPVPPTEKEN